MAINAPRRRLLVLALLLGACFAALCYRLVDLQVFRHQKLGAQASAQHRRSIFKEPARGDIRDVRGNVLATSERVETVCVDPALLITTNADFRPAMARLMAPLLQLTEPQLLQSFAKIWRTNEQGRALTNHFVVLKRKVSVEDWEKINRTLDVQFTNAVREALLRFNAANTGTRHFKPRSKLPPRELTKLTEVWKLAVFAEDDYLRTYPNHQLASHVLGFTSVETTNVDGRPISSNVGREGVEWSMDNKLAGVRGWMLTETDSRRRELVAFREQDVEAHPGLNVVLSLDARVQQIVEEEIAAVMQKHSAAGVTALVVRPRTGQILAMASVPTFDPNRLTGTTDEMRRNRTVVDTAEPGSTFKIVTVSGAIEEKIVKLEDQFDCEHGSFYFAGAKLSDHGKGYGVLSVEDIVESSNIGTAKIALKMGETTAFRYIRDFGFGRKTGIELRAESAGILHPLKDWTKISISRVPIGQGVAATQLQMALAMSAVANGGRLMRPMLVDHLQDASGHIVTQYQPQEVRKVISESTARQMVEAMKGVVARGTGVKAKLDNYTVAGKTGTAQKPLPGGGYNHEKFFASFIGFFPADAPELCISVSVDEPNTKGNLYYGGACAAPAFKRIAERAAGYLNIRPDIIPPADSTGQPPVLTANRKAN